MRYIALFLLFIGFGWIGVLLFGVAALLLFVGVMILVGLIKLLYPIYLIKKGDRPITVVEDITQPLDISRCPACKSSQIKPIAGYQSLWECANCAYEFDPMARVRERKRLTDSWREANGAKR